MILNYDYRRMFRAGYFAEKRIPQRENEAGVIVFWCMAFAAMIVLAVMFQSCAGSTGVMGSVR